MAAPLQAAIPPSPLRPLISLGKSSTSATTNFATVCCVAFACHYNSVKYYMELESRSVKKFTATMAKGFGATAAVFLSMVGCRSGASEARSSLVTKECVRFIF